MGFIAIKNPGRPSFPGCARIMKFAFNCSPVRGFKESGGIMSIAVLGGLDRLKNSYKQKGKDLGHEIKVFSQRVPDMVRRLRGVHYIVIFTGTIAHPMVKDARRAARRYDIPIELSHSSSISAFHKCLTEIS